MPTGPTLKISKLRPEPWPTLSRLTRRLQPSKRLGKSARFCVWENHHCRARKTWVQVGYGGKLLNRAIILSRIIRQHRIVRCNYQGKRIQLSRALAFSECIIETS